MAGESTSPNMNLILPGVGVTLGPTWATDLNTSLNLIDSHDHSAGSGIAITPAGININTDLTMANNNLIAIKSSRMQVQSAVLAGASDLGCLFVTGVDLYYNDVNGNHVRITESGGVAGTPGSISNLTSPASAAYVSASSTFVWQSNANTPAIMDSGYLILRNISTSGFGITLTPPTLSSNYTLTLPALPASQKIMTLDNSGNLSAPYVVDNSSLEISTNTIRVKDLGITTAKINTDAVTTAKVLDANITRAKLVAVGQQISTSSAGFTSSSGSIVDVTNLTVTITTTGRPVVIRAQPATSSTDFGRITLTRAAAAMNANINIERDSVRISRFQIGLDVAAAGNLAITHSPDIITYLDVVAAGTYVYKVSVSVTGTIGFENCVLTAYEL